MKDINYDKILQSKIDYYGETKAAYEFAANQYAIEKVNSILDQVMWTAMPDGMQTHIKAKLRQNILEMKII